jgi:probable HAF family extracellular repeat protein
VLTLAATMSTVAALAAGLTAAAPASAATTTYTITDLGTLGGFFTVPAAINNNGQVTGVAALSKEIQVPCYGGSRTKKCFEQIDHAFLWSSGTMTDLGTLGGDGSAGVAINGPGDVVGSTTTKDGVSESFLWNGQRLTALGNVNPFGINDSGEVVGVCDPAAVNGGFPCTFSNGTGTALPNPAGMSCSVGARSETGSDQINNNGQVIGACEDSSGVGHAVVWTNGTPAVLPTLGGSSMVPTAINNLGQVTGYGSNSAGNSASWLWSNGTMTTLTTTTSAASPTLYPAAMNDSGVIVGLDNIYSNGTLQDVTNVFPPYQIDYLIGINDNGQIIATAFDTAVGQYHALLLTPN